MCINLKIKIKIRKISESEKIGALDYGITVDTVILKLIFVSFSNEYRRMACECIHL